MKRIMVPVNVGIKRYYRMFVEVNEDATSEEIRETAAEHIVNGQDEEIELDPDLEIEKDDILHIDIDYDGVQMEGDEDEDYEEEAREDAW